MTNLYQLTVSIIFVQLLLTDVLCLLSQTPLKTVGYIICSINFYVYDDTDSPITTSGIVLQTCVLLPFLSSCL